jgi:alpha-galactosidase
LAFSVHPSAIPAWAPLPYGTFGAAAARRGILRQTAGGVLCNMAQPMRRPVPLIRALLVMMLALSASRIAAAASIAFDPATRIFRLDGGGASYAMRITADGKLRALYWGAARAAAAPFEIAGDPPANDVAAGQIAQEFPGQGGGLDREAALKGAFPDGNRDLVLRYRSHTIDGDTLSIVLADIIAPVMVDLRYAIDGDTGIVSRSATVRNGTAGPLRIDQLMAAAFTLPAGNSYRMRYLTGRWTGEFGVRSRPIDAAATVLESRHGSTGVQSNPWLAIAGDPSTDENHGAVYFAALAWSGSWRIVTEQIASGEVRITGGFNPYDFGYTLAPGETLATPVFHGGFAAGGFGDASRLLHRFARNRILPRRDGVLPLRKVLYNSWEATLFNVTQAGQMALADRAAKLGVERFVIDDGWFSGRHDDHAGLGDWLPDKVKFPDGLGPVIRHVHARGMQFGLWVEPEMINPNSDLYRRHPDWVINFAGRPRSESRNQLVLNLARADVRDHLLATLDRLLRENRIDFLKWDHNRTWSEPGWPQVAPADQQRLYIAYIRNLYGILAELRRRHPAVEIESCASGGGRADLGIMALTDQVWTSDNTDPFDRLAIQDGFTQAYPPAVMMAWVTASPSWTGKRATSLHYRFLSAMQGGLGIGDNLANWTAAETAIATRMIAEYKTIRATVQQGDLYRLVSPAPGAAMQSATFSVSSDQRQAVLFSFRRVAAGQATAIPIVLRGLEPKLRYRARLIGGGALPPGMPIAATGAAWMQALPDLPMAGEYQAAGLILDAVP